MELLFINEKFHQLKKKKETNKQISTTKTKQKLKLYSIYIYNSYNSNSSNIHS